jgi:Flp pilus assembly protein TadG
MTHRRLTRIQQNEDGAAIVEMAIALPVLVSMIYGIFTLGQLFEANAGIQHGLGEGARFATLCPSLQFNATANSTKCTLPTGTDIKARVNSKLFGTRNGTFDAPTLDTTTASTGYVTLGVTYHQTMNFLLFTGPTVDLARSKRVYLSDIPPTQSDCDAATTPEPSCSIYS